ncbi:tail fiber domain-containing protein, partial [Sutcliffiella cohnii]
TPHTMIQLGNRITLKALNGSIHQLQIRNTADSAYLPVVASEFVTSSRIDTKKNIEDYTGDALRAIRLTGIKTYHRKGESDLEAKHIGIIYEDAPVEVVDPSGQGVSIYAMEALSWKAIQQLDSLQSELSIELQQLKDQINDLSIENQLLKCRVKKLEAQVA